MSTIQKPTNAIAVEVARLQSNNIDLDTQIEALTERKEQNCEAIAELEPHATWETVAVIVDDPPTVTEAASTD